MKSLYSFIVKPFDDRYNNVKKIDDKYLILNTSIENYEFVSKKAVVVETPAAFKTKIKQGNIVLPLLKLNESDLTLLTSYIF